MSTTNGRKLRAALYLRQSKDLTGEMAAVTRQRKALLEYCARRDFVVTAEFVDNDVSASTRKKRPQFELMMSEAELIATRSFDIIVALEIDRLTRRPIEAERLIDLHDRAGMLLATQSGDHELETDDGRFKLRLFVAIARKEMERKSARHKLADEQKADNGGLPSARSFGYVGHELHPTEAPALRQAYDELLRGCSFVSIAKHLNEQGFRSRKSGTLITNVTIRKIMRNPRNCGHNGLNGEIRGKGTWEPIVDRSIFEAALSIMDANRPHHNGIGTARRWVGAGLYRCGVDGCEHDVKSVVNTTVSDVSRRRAYRCRAGSHLTRSNAVAIDAFVESAICERLSHPELTSKLLDDRSDEIIALKRQLAVLTARELQIEDDRADGTYTKEAYKRQIVRLDAERRKLRDELGNHIGNNVLAPVMRSDDPIEHYLALPVMMRAEVINALAVVTLLPPKIGGVRRTTIDENDVRIDWRDTPIG